MGIRVESRYRMILVQESGFGGRSPFLGPATRLGACRAHFVIVIRSASSGACSSPGRWKCRSCSMRTRTSRLCDQSQVWMPGRIHCKRPVNPKLCRQEDITKACSARWYVLEQDQIVEVPVQKQVQIPMVQTVQRHKGLSIVSLRSLKCLLQG